MNIGQSILIALGMLRLHKMRSFLTMLGVIIGVMSVTMIVMISNGFQAYIDGQFQKLGADTLFIFFDPGRRNRGQTTGGVDRLTTDDLAYLKERVASLDLLSGSMGVAEQPVRFNGKSLDNPRISAVDENFSQLNRFNLLEGREIRAGDVQERANVCLIGEDIRDRLFPDKKAIGKMVLLNGIALEVIGVIEKSSFLGDSTSRMMLVPLSTAQDKWVGGNRLDFITARAKKGANVDEVMDSIWQSLMLKTHNKPIYRVDSNESILKVFGGVIGVAGAVLAAIAALSLLVGGIGIMNIMLVSVTERTKEIGLRKAVGAKRASVLMQFLVEAGTLSLVGGLIGMAIAWGLGQIVNLITMSMKWPNADGLATPFPVTAGIFAALFSALIGMVFGLYPAISASRLDPIVALRRE